ncbi:30S ribosomal protein S4 [Candidatus Uhrbacteria bacterium]|nr:30S ribosomal protein S4 [Candidatus Uhrbacteria bacterium]
MARYLGPTHKLCRRVGEKMCDSAKCPITRRSYPSGAHGPKGRPKKPTTYGLEVVEKQKAKRTYGLMERQFSNYYTRAVSRVGDTSVFLGQLLEQRLDNVVYRLGLARTHQQARQIVSHGHITVNGKKVNIPSYHVRVGEMIGLKEKSAANSGLGTARTGDTRDCPGWLSFDSTTHTGKVTTLPTQDNFPKNINFKLIIEHYSR